MFIESKIKKVTILDNEVSFNCYIIWNQFFLIVHSRDRKRIELSNDSIRLDSTEPNRIESNINFEKVGRIESNRI